MTKVLTMLLFGVVIVAGESFKIQDVNVAVVLMLAIAAWVSVSSIVHSLTGVRRYFWLVTISLIFLTIGIHSNRIEDVAEDFLPFAALFLVIAALATLRPEQRLQFYRFVIVASALASLKAIAMSYLDVTPEWGGNTFWQGGKAEIAPGQWRIILKGGDVFICVSTAILISGTMLRRGLPQIFRRTTGIVLLAATTTGVAASLTRASGAAIGLALLFWGSLLLGSGLLRFRRALILMIVASVFVLPAAGTWFQAYNERWSDLISLGSRGLEDDIALSFRRQEANKIIAISEKSNFLGAGFGTSYYLAFSGSQKSDGRSLYAHSLPVWLLFKAGVAGLCAFYVTLLLRIISPMRKLRRLRDTALRQDPRFIRSLCLASAASVGLLFLFFNDFTNNKFATLSGASAYAMLFAMSDEQTDTQGASKTKWWGLGVTRSQ